MTFKGPFWIAVKFTGHDERESCKVHRRWGGGYTPHISHQEKPPSCPETKFNHRNMWEGRQWLRWSSCSKTQTGGGETLLQWTSQFDKEQRLARPGYFCQTWEKYNRTQPELGRHSTWACLQLAKLGLEILQCELGFIICYWQTF